MAEYEKIIGDDYDDSGWTDEEMALIAAEVHEMLDDDMGIEDPTP